jgi:hypothetical protein
MNDTLSYIKTGFKLALLSFVVGLIYTLINFVIVTVFGASMLAAVMGAKTGIVLYVIIFFILVWLALTLYIGGWLAQKMWKWD